MNIKSTHSNHTMLLTMLNNLGKEKKSLERRDQINRSKSKYISSSKQKNTYQQIIKKTMDQWYENKFKGANGYKIQYHQNQSQLKKNYYQMRYDSNEKQTQTDEIVQEQNYNSKGLKNRLPYLSNRTQQLKSRSCDDIVQPYSYLPRIPEQDKMTIRMSNKLVKIIKPQRKVSQQDECLRGWEDQRDRNSLEKLLI